jgi:hypothetical protein
MGLAEVLRGGVALADRLTASLQATVSHEAWSGNNADGEATYAAPVNRQAIVEEGRRPRALANGDVVVVKAHILFLRPTAVDARDRFTTPSGVTGPIVDTDHVMNDPAALAGYYAGVWIGDKVIRG